MGFVGNYALYGLAPQMQNMPVIQKKRPEKPTVFVRGIRLELTRRN